VRYTATGDLLFTKANSATLCADFSSSSPPYIAQVHDDVVGGTGKFAQATGSFSTTEKGAFLSFDAGKRAFGWFQSDIVTILNAP
jgi:hypothetical protein